MSLPNKIVITGTSGCGKTTLGHKLSALIGEKCIDLDDLYWLPNWTPRPDEEFLNLIQQEIILRRMDNLWKLLTCSTADLGAS